MADTTTNRGSGTSKSEFTDVEMAPLKQEEPTKPIIPAAKQAANTKVVSACAMYTFCSVTMVLTNKSLASR